MNSEQNGVIVLECNQTHDKNTTADQVQLFFFFPFVCYHGFNSHKEEREREKRKEGGGDKQAQ